MSDPTRQRILLTGASGTLGFHVLEQLASVPHTKVLALQRASSQVRKTHPFVQCESVDFHDHDALSKLVERFSPTCLIHCAATNTQFDRARWFEMIRFNVDVTLRLCESVSRVAGCHFIYIGTGLAYRDQDRPLRENDALDSRHPYGASKAAADILVRAAAAEFGVKLTVLRPFSFTGISDDSQRLFPSLLRAAAENRPLELSPCDQVRDHCAAQDIAAAIVAATEAPTDRSAGLQPALELGESQAGCKSPLQPQNLRVFNLGSGKTDSLKSVIENVVADLELKVELHFGTRAYMPFEPKFLAADISQAQKILQWNPRTNLSYAVWQFARQNFPDLKIRQPKEFV